MKVIIASENGLEGKTSTHFAHCTEFIIFEIKENKITNTKIEKNPYFQNHVPGAIPEFVKSLGADVLITDGIGPTAIELLGKMKIKVIFGEKGTPKKVIEDFLKGKLKENTNPCDH